MMLQTEEQRRWWFATHPEFSSSRKGAKAGTHEKRERESSKVSPEAVDAYVDRMLPYQDGPVADLLRSIKKNFGTEGEKGKHYQRIAREDPPPPRSGDGDSGGGKDDGAKQPTFGQSVLMGMRNSLQDMATLLQVLTGTGGKRWKVGDDTLKPTPKGNDPSYEAQRQRVWKNKAAEEGAVDKWGPENVERMKKGLAPQRRNPATGEWESRELHHDPIPKREGGKEVIDLWPDEHADVDPHRRLRKR